MIPIREAHREALAPKNNFPSTSSNPTFIPNTNPPNPSSFFTPEQNMTAANGITGGPRMQANGLPFRMNGGVGPRDSLYVIILS